MEVLPGVKVGDTVSFELFNGAKAIVPTKFENVIIRTPLDLESVSQVIDPISLHRNIYPTLPEGTVEDNPDYMYLKVRLPNGQDTAVGIPWIDQTTIEVRNSTDLQIIVPNASTLDAQRIRQLLSAGGYTMSSITEIKK